MADLTIKISALQLAESTIENHDSFTLGNDSNEIILADNEFIVKYLPRQNITAKFLKSEKLKKLILASGSSKPIPLNVIQSNPFLWAFLVKHHKTVTFDFEGLKLPEFTANKTKKWEGDLNKNIYHYLVDQFLLLVNPQWSDLVGDYTDQESLANMIRIIRAFVNAHKYMIESNESIFDIVDKISKQYESMILGDHSIEDALIWLESLN